MSLQHLRSSTANKRPVPGNMSEGQLALNSNNGSPGLFFRDSNSNLVKVGPVHVGTTAPNASPAVGGTAGNSVGEQWLDTTGGTYVFKVWDGTAWRSESGTFVDASGDVMTGALGIIAGSAATPGLYVSGDTNTGIYSPGADQLAISTGGAERMRIDSAGNVNVTTAALAQYFGINATGTAASVANGLFAPTGNILGFVTNATERARIDSSGRLLVGTSSSITGVFSNAAAVQFNASFGTQALALTRFTANNFGADIDFLKSRNATVGAHTIVQSGDQIANLNFAGSDGSAFIATAGISANIDGTPGLNDMPGRLVFSTTADGASTPTERMRIDSAGRVGIGTVPGAENFGVNRNVSGGTTAFSIYTAGVIQSDVTTQASYYAVAAQTAAAAFTLADLRCFNATQGTFGVGSAVTNQYGYFVAANLTGATNNYGFFSNIPAATGRWNFYAANTADSYFASNNFIFANGGTERARIDSSGRLLVGTSTARSNFYNLTNITPFVQYEGASSDNQRSVSQVYGNVGNAGPYQVFAKHRGATTGLYTAVVAEDEIGTIDFQGADGSEFVTAARISVFVDGTPGANDMPGRLVFSTTADGAASQTEQLRITNGGTVVYNQPAPAAVDVTATLTVANLTAKIITSSTAAAVTMTLPTGTLMDGGFSGLYTNMAFEWSVINTGATNAVTVQGGTGHTVVGSGTVAASNSVRFVSRRTAATTWVTYRIS